MEAIGTPRYPFLDFLNGLHAVREHRGFRIFCFKEAYRSSEGWIDLYIGYRPEHTLIEGFGLKSVLSEIDETEQM